MSCRAQLNRCGRKLYVDHTILQAQATNASKVRAAVSSFNPDRRRALLRWLDKEGPHWDTDSHHSPDEYFVCDSRQADEVVTESAVAEVAHLNSMGIPSALISVAPSDWCIIPLEVSLLDDGGTKQYSVAISNYWNAESVTQVLRNIAPPPASWSEFDSLARQRFGNIRFAGDWLRPVRHRPIEKAAVSATFRLLEILNELRHQIEVQGRSPAEARSDYERFFRRSGGMFSDSSSSEKQRFRARLTFNDPDHLGNDLFCPWHGKIRRLTWRLHFSSPLSSSSPLCVVYLGPKLTAK